MLLPFAFYLSRGLMFYLKEASWATHYKSFLDVIVEVYKFHKCAAMAIELSDLHVWFSTSVKSFLNIKLLQRAPVSSHHSFLVISSLELFHSLVPFLGKRLPLRPLQYRNVYILETSWRLWKGSCRPLFLYAVMWDCSFFTRRLFHIIVLNCILGLCACLSVFIGMVRLCMTCAWAFRAHLVLNNSWSGVHYCSAQAAAHCGLSAHCWKLPAWIPKEITREHAVQVCSKYE